MPKIRKVSVTVVVDPRQREYILELAEQPGYSMGEVVRELLTEAIAARQARELVNV